jgi:SH3 domain protein
MIWRKVFIVAMLTLPLTATAEQKQYISDDITLSVRDQPSNSGTVIGAVKSGDPVTVLTSLGEQSFARVRTAGGLEGWVTARYLSDHPAAKDQLTQTRQSLETARGQIQDLQRELESAKKQLSQMRPAQELATDNNNLRAQLAEKERADAALRQRYDEEESRRQTFLVGGGLVAFGIIVGLFLPWLGGRKRKRRYGDF